MVWVRSSGQGSLGLLQPLLHQPPHLVHATAAAAVAVVSLHASGACTHPVTRIRARRSGSPDLDHLDQLAILKGNTWAGGASRRGGRRQVWFPAVKSAHARGGATGGRGRGHE